MLEDDISFASYSAQAIADQCAYINDIVAGDVFGGELPEKEYEELMKLTAVIRSLANEIVKITSKAVVAKEKK